jgi:hypothetical protein
MIGEVSPGHRLAGEWIRTNPTVYAQALGSPVWPGTLNVCVAGKVDLFANDVVPFPSAARDRQLNYLPCTVNGHAGFILRTEYPAPSLPILIEAPCTMLEIVCVEQVPQIRYGTLVELDY